MASATSLFPLSAQDPCEKTSVLSQDPEEEKVGNCTAILELGKTRLTEIEV